MTVAELMRRLGEMPPGATAVDQDELEVIAVAVSRDQATVKIWTEQK